MVKEGKRQVGEEKTEGRKFEEEEKWRKSVVHVRWNRRKVSNP